MRRATAPARQARAPTPTAPSAAPARAPGQTLVQSGAGYGKSTALATLDHGGPPVF